MIPCDLSEFDMQVQQAGLQSYPWLWATDVENSTSRTSSRYTWATTMASTQGSPACVLAVPTPPLLAQPGDGIAGEGITPGTTLLAVNSTSGVATLSAPAAATVATGSVFGGTGVPVAYAYPPPSGAYPVTIRFQALMPPLVNTASYPWFPHDGYLIDALAGEMMKITDDARVVEFLGDGARPGRAQRTLQTYMGNLDDKRSRPQTVEMDRRRFGPSMRVLPNTKTIGWMVLLCIGIGWYSCLSNIGAATNAQQQRSYYQSSESTRVAACEPGQTSGEQQV